MKGIWMTMAVVAPLVIVTACTDAAKGPAEAAMAAASTAMDSLKGDAAKYEPEAVKKLQSAYDVAKDSLGNRDYQGVLTFTKDIPARTKELLAKVEAAKAELAKGWGEASSSMARTVDAAKSHLHALAKAKKLPAGVDKAALAKAHAEIESLQADWTAATEQYKGGDLRGAVVKAKELNARGLELLKAIGVK